MFGCERHNINALNLGTISNEVTTTYTDNLSPSHDNHYSVDNISCPVTVTLAGDYSDIGLTITGTTLSLSNDANIPVGTYTKSLVLTLKDHVGATVRTSTETFTVVIYGCERHNINALNLSTIENEVSTTYT